jgi:hypothetical protein
VDLLLSRIVKPVPARKIAALLSKQAAGQRPKNIV